MIEDAREIHRKVSDLVSHAKSISELFDWLAEQEIDYEVDKRLILVCSPYKAIYVQTFSKDECSLCIYDNSIENAAYHNIDIYLVPKEEREVFYCGTAY